MFDTDGNQIVDKKEFLVVSIELISSIKKNFNDEKKLLSSLYLVLQLVKGK